MRKVFCLALLSLAILGTVAVSADEEERDVRPPIVAVSPNEATVDPYTRFMLTVSYRYTRFIRIGTSYTSEYSTTILEGPDSYKSDLKSLEYFSLLTHLISL